MIILRILAFALLVGGAAAVIQLVATERDRRAHPAPGQLVDVGGYRLHVVARGPHTAAPTVILEGGAGLGSVTWGWVQPRLAETTRVVAYDRAGIGWSDRGPDPRDGQQIAQLRVNPPGPGWDGVYTATHK